MFKGMAGRDFLPKEIMGHVILINTSFQAKTVTVKKINNKNRILGISLAPNGTCIYIF